MLRIPKWIIIFAFIISANGVTVSAQKKYTVIFYNVENLFDIWDDPTTSDEEFTPRGERHWTMQRFEDKIRMIYKALITAGEGQFPDIIGLAEVENRWVVEQLISHTPLNRVPYGIIHKESPDPRGIDVALLYRKDRIKPIDFRFIPVSGYGKNPFQSRDILHFTAQLGTNQIDFFVNHWPSRSGGYIETREKRNIAAAILKQGIDSLLNDNMNAKILIMGDFNATPNEECFVSILKAVPYPGDKDSKSLINLATLWSKQAEGTIKNSGQWEIFDQMICSPDLLMGNTLKIVPQLGGICDFWFLLEPDPTYLGKKPFRTYLGPVYHGGISDHLPVKICLSSN